MTGSCEGEKHVGGAGGKIFRIRKAHRGCFQVSQICSQAIYIFQNTFARPKHYMLQMEDRGYSSSRRPRSPHRPRRDEYRVSKSHSSHHAHHKRKHSVSPFETRPLPFNARRLDKRDLTLYEPLLASYLDIQKGIALDEVDDAEAKGRWKSFVKKWYVLELMPLGSQDEVSPFR